MRIMLIPILIIQHLGTLYTILVPKRSQVHMYKHIYKKCTLYKLNNSLQIVDTVWRDCPDLGVSTIYYNTPLRLHGY